MSEKTKSETIFENYCEALAIPFVRIPCEKKKTPDYKLRFGNHQVIAEIKQLDLNDEDKFLWRDARSRGVGSAWGGTEDRIGKKIGKANKQLKTQCQGQIPGIIVVFDNGTFRGIDGTDIREAMFGTETGMRPSKAVSGERKLITGRDGNLNPSKNTTTSALALMKGDGGSCLLTLYHNPFATHRVDPDWFRHDRLKHYSLSTDCYGWTEI